MERKVGEIWRTNIGKRHKETKRTYYCVKLPNGVMKFGKLETAQKWASLYVEGKKDVEE